MNARCLGAVACMWCAILLCLQLIIRGYMVVVRSVNMSNAECESTPIFIQQQAQH
jgi:hypothetical protein